MKITEIGRKEIEKNMNTQKIEIKSKYEGGSIFTELYIDGHKINGVRSLKFERKVGDSLPTLKLDLNALNVAIDQECLLFADGFGEMEIRFKENEPSEESPIA